MNISLRHSILGFTVIALTLALGCASSAAVPAERPTKAGPSALVTEGAGPTPQKEETLVAASVGEPAPTPVEAPAKAGPTAAVSDATEPASEKKTVPVGLNVGERLPGFAIHLADGTTVTSQQLALEGKPAFLMFFATW